MLGEEATYWICQNRNCGKTRACDENERELETRACECGSWMKKETHATVFSYLNFLRETGSNEPEKKEEDEKACERSMWGEQPCGGELPWL
jgi:hypothetical protein